MPASPQDRKKKSTTRKSKVTSVKAWKEGANTEEIEVPSGNVALVKRVGPEAFLSSGSIPDALTPIIDEAIKDKKGMAPSEMVKMLVSEDGLPQMLDMMNRVCAYAVVEPKVLIPPDCVAMVPGQKEGTEEVCDKPLVNEVHKEHEFVEGERDSEALYADEVSLDDRIFIMNFVVGGTRDLATFRSEHEELVARISTGEDVEDQAE